MAAFATLAFALTGCQSAPGGRKGMQTIQVDRIGGHVELRSTGSDGRRRRNGSDSGHRTRRSGARLANRFSLGALAAIPQCGAHAL